MRHAIISIHPEHVAGILSGEKTVEIRTRKAELAEGTFLWIYATLPIGEIQLVAKVMKTHFMSPTKTWGLFEESIGLTRSEFRTYVNGSPRVLTIELGSVRQLNHPLSLSALRKADGRFQPPQFLMHLDGTHPIYRLLEKAKPVQIS